ncbi:MAG: CopD family protein [Alphaproteobacteria bacterium]|nr:CopD family protein [Alphaproteobacteria bacterium]
MTGFLGDWLLYVKAAHIVLVIFWMAGLFMLPRFFVYHQEDHNDPAMAEKWVERERRLMRIILDPAMVGVWAFGLILASDEGVFGESWFHLKLLVVLGLSAYHLWLGRYAEQLAQGRLSLSGKRLRLLNEVPGIAAIIIIYLVIVKPL